MLPSGKSRKVKAHLFDGYDVPPGEIGVRRIKQREATIVRGIFRDY